MSVLLLNPPSPPHLQSNRDYMGNYGIMNPRPGVVLPPHHLVQMGGTIDPKQVHFLDASAENLNFDQTQARISEISAFDLAIVLTATPTFLMDCDMARWVKDTYQNKKVFLFGPQPAHVPTEAFERSGADGILVGHTDTTLKKLLTQSDLTNIQELMLPDQIVSPPPIAPNFDMNDLPFGCWELTPLKRYRFDLREPQPFATMRTSLGCLYDCAYCPYVLAEGQRFLSMTPERIYAEMEYLSLHLGVRFILFRDLLFTAKKKRIEDLCELLLKKPLPLKWRAETSTQHLTHDLLKLMAKAGCNGMNLGVESTDETSSDEMNLLAKRRSLDHVRDVFRWCRELHIKANAMFVFGFPEDSREGILASIQFGKELDAETVQLGFAVPFPGTTLATIAKNEHLIKSTEWSDYSSLIPITKTRYLSQDELGQLVREGLREIVLRPKNILRSLKNPLEFVRRANGFMNFYLKRS